MATAAADVGGAGDRSVGDGQVSRLTFVAGAIVALVVGGIIGLGVGWKLEQSRVKSDVKNIRPVGVVTAIDGSSITIDLKSSSGTRTFVLTKDTTVDATSAGTTTDVAKGAIVLVKGVAGDNGKQRASEIVVLPASTKLGR